MADKNLQIKISATDSASPVFRKLGSEANAAAKQIDTGAKQAGKSLDTLSDSAKKTEVSTKSLLSANTAVSVGFAAIGASIGLYSRQIVDNQQAVATLQRTYGEAASGLQQFANQVQATTVFSSEQAIAAENSFGTLVRNYGLSVDQVQQLVQVSTDLAATSGLTLEDTATRVQAAIRGEAESAEALGLTMNQQAIDRNNLTLTMTAQEAAQFRLNALLDQSAFAQGAAAQQADTTAGRIRQMANSFDDAAKRVIGLAGPLPQVVSGLSSMGMEAGLAVTGIASLGKGVRDLSSAVGGIGKLGTAFSLLSNPIAIAGVAVAGMTAIAVSNILAHGDSVEKLNEEYEKLATTIEHMPDMGATPEQTAAVQHVMDQLKLTQQLIEIQSQNAGLMGQITFTVPGLDASYVKSANEVQNILLEGILSADEEKKAVELVNEAISKGGQNLDNVIPRINDLIGQYQLWIQSNGQLGISGDELLTQLGELTTYADSYGTAAAKTAEANNKLASSFASVTTAIAGVVASDADQSLSNTAIALQSTTVQVLDSIAAFTQLKDAYWGLSGGTQAYAELQKDVNNILANGTEDQLRELAALEAMHRSHQISADTFAIMVDDLNNSVTESAAANDLAEASQQRLNAAMDAGEASARKEAAGISELSETGQRGSASLTTLRDIVDSNGETASRTAGQFTKLADAIEHVTKMAEIDRGTAETVTRSYDAWRGEADALVITHDKLNDSLQGGTDELAAYLELANSAAKSIGVLSTNAQLFQAAGIKSPSLDVAVNLQGGQGAFDAVFGAIKQAQSMSQSIGGAKSWADELIGDPGTWTELDKLLEEGRINVDQYNAAQAAQVSISQDVTNAQRDLLAVQVNLAPALADVTKQQAEYIDSLQNLNAEQQIAALGFMDTAESSKAMQLAQLAAASSTDTMQASTTAMITEMAASDPVLKQMLLQMGLISEGADGTISVNFDEANSANDAMTELTKSIDALIVALGGIPPIHTETNAKGTQKDVDGLTDSIYAIPPTASTVINAVDAASGTIALVGQLLAGIDGRTANVYVNAIRTGDTLAAIGAGLATGGTISAMATGGTMEADIPRYAIGGTHGGSYAIVGDGGGPEMVWLPTGAQVTNAVTTRSKRQSIEARRSGDINMYGPVTLNPAGSDAYAAIQQEMMGGARR